MQYEADAIMYAHWAFIGLPEDPGVPSVELEGEWHALAWWDDIADPTFEGVAEELGVSMEDVAAGTARIARVLLVGPAAGASPSGGVGLTRGGSTRVRLVDDPETIIIRTENISIQ